MNRVSPSGSPKNFLLSNSGKNNLRLSLGIGTQDISPESLNTAINPENSHSCESPRFTIVESLEPVSHMGLDFSPSTYCKPLEVGTSADTKVLEVGTSVDTKTPWIQKEVEETPWIPCDIEGTLSKIPPVGFYQGGPKDSYSNYQKPVDFYPEDPWILVGKSKKSTG